MNKYQWHYELSEPLAKPHRHIMHLTSNQEVADMVSGLDEVTHVSEMTHEGKDITIRHVIIHQFLDPETAWIIIDDAIQAFIKHRQNEQKWESALPDELAE